MTGTWSKPPIQVALIVVPPHVDVQFCEHGCCAAEECNQHPCPPNCPDPRQQDQDVIDLLRSYADDLRRRWENAEADYQRARETLPL